MSGGSRTQAKRRRNEKGALTMRAPACFSESVEASAARSRIELFGLALALGFVVSARQSGFLRVDVGPNLERTVGENLQHRLREASLIDFSGALRSREQ